MTRTYNPIPDSKRLWDISLYVANKIPPETKVPDILTP